MSFRVCIRIYVFTYDMHNHKKVVKGARDADVIVVGLQECEYEEPKEAAAAGARTRSLRGKSLGDFFQRVQTSLDASHGKGSYSCVINKNLVIHSPYLGTVSLRPWVLEPPLTGRDEAGFVCKQENATAHLRGCCRC